MAHSVAIWPPAPIALMTCISCAHDDALQASPCLTTPLKYGTDHFLLGAAKPPLLWDRPHHVPDTLIARCTHHANFLRSLAIWTAYSALINVSDCSFRATPGSLFYPALKKHSWTVNITSNFSEGKNSSSSNAKARYGSSQIELGSPTGYPGQPRSLKRNGENTASGSAIYTKMAALWRRL